LRTPAAPRCAFLATARERPDGAIDVELVKELAFLLFSIAEKKNGWTQDALAFNTVATRLAGHRASCAFDARLQRANRQLSLSRRLDRWRSSTAIVLAGCSS
jgi:hypothetical protein